MTWSCNPIFLPNLSNRTAPYVSRPLEGLLRSARVTTGATRFRLYRSVWHDTRLCRTLSSIHPARRPSVPVSPPSEQMGCARARLRPLTAEKENAAATRKRAFGSPAGVSEPARDRGWGAWPTTGPEVPGRTPLPSTSRCSSSRSRCPESAGPSPWGLATELT